MPDEDFEKLMEIAAGKFEQLNSRIGSICSNFAIIELELINAIGLLLDDCDLTVGEIVTDRLSYSQTVDLFERLAKHRLRDHLPIELPDLLAKLRKAAPIRNEVVHSSWSYTVDEKPELRQERVRRKYSTRNGATGTITWERFPEFAEFLWSVYKELTTFEREYL